MWTKCVLFTFKIPHCVGFQSIKSMEVEIAARDYIN